MSEAISIAEYHRLTKAQANTRGNERVTVDGHAFDSIAESRRYADLKLMQQAGTITDLSVHPLYELQAAFQDSAGARQRAISYEGDFSYQENGRAVCEDVKGHRTAVFLLKSKMFKFRYPAIELRIIEV